MEAFYQESGRAGRDQLPSKSLLYYGIEDRRRMVNFWTWTCCSLLSLGCFIFTLLFIHLTFSLLQEFILRNSSSADKKILPSSSSQEKLSEKSLTDFIQVIFFFICNLTIILFAIILMSWHNWMQMVEYCEGSGCRRKQILESFGEQVVGRC